MLVLRCRGALNDESSKLGATQIQLGHDTRPMYEAPVDSEGDSNLLDLIASIRKLEEYLIVREVERPVQEGWPFALGSASFYLWLKETYRRRFLRPRYFNPEYFSGEAAWNILLDLAAALIEGKRIAVTSACIASGVPPTTALRWISLLEEDGMILKENDFSDKRRTFLRISDRGMALINSYYNDLHSYPKIPRRKSERS
jgi:hypothetical protein